MPMKLAGGGHSNHATPTRGSVFVVEEELQEPQNRNGVEIITTERDPEGLRTSPAPVEFTHSKTGSGDGCNPRLNAAALMDLPPWSPDRTSRVLRPWLPAPRPWQWTEIWDRSSPTRRSPPECQPLPLIIYTPSFPFTPFFPVDVLYPPNLLHLLPSLRRDL
jgi:hypothetical protein